MEKKRHSYTVSGNVSRCSHRGKQYTESSKQLKTDLPFDAEIPLLVIYPKEIKTGYRIQNAPLLKNKSILTTTIIVLFYGFFPFV